MHMLCPWAVLGGVFIAPLGTGEPIKCVPTSANSGKRRALHQTFLSFLLAEEIPGCGMLRALGESWKQK